MDQIWSDLVAFAGPILDRLAQIATSWLAWRVYALLLAAGIAFASVWYAGRQDWMVKERLKDLKSFRGPSPTRRETILKQLGVIEAHKAYRLRFLTSATVKVLLFGFVVPSILLLMGIRCYAWFRPGVLPLISSNGCSSAVADPSLWGSIQFVLLQLTMGVADAHLSGGLLKAGGGLSGGEAYLPADKGVGLAIVSYRYFVGGFAALLALLGRTIFTTLMFPLNEVQRKLQRALAAAPASP